MPVDPIGQMQVDTSSDIAIETGRPGLRRLAMSLSRSLSSRTPCGCGMHASIDAARVPIDRRTPRQDDESALALKFRDDGFQ